MSSRYIEKRVKSVVEGDKTVVVTVRVGHDSDWKQYYVSINKESIGDRLRTCLPRNGQRIKIEDCKRYSEKRLREISQTILADGRVLSAVETVWATPTP